MDVESNCTVKEQLCSMDVEANCTVNEDNSKYLATGISELKDNRTDNLFVDYLSKCPKLVSLNLSNNKIGKYMVDCLQVLIPKLEVLDLSWNEIEKEDVAKIGELLSNCSLQDLNLSWNNFEGEGAKEVVKNLEKSTTLRSLHLNGTKIGDNDFEQIVKKVVQNSSIVELSLSCNLITAPSNIKDLYDHPSLKYLDISNNPLPITKAPYHSALMIIQQPDDIKHKYAKPQSKSNGDPDQNKKDDKGPNQLRQVSSYQGSFTKK